MDQYSPRKGYIRLYGTSIYILYNKGETFLAIIHIYGTIVILLLFCDHQDTESD